MQVKRERSECLKGLGTAIATDCHLMKNPDYFGRHGISYELADRMGLKPCYNKDGFFVGFASGSGSFEIRITSLERWKAKLAENRNWKRESEKIVINYLKNQKNVSAEEGI